MYPPWYLLFWGGLGLLLGCGSASLVLRGPLADQCQGVGLEKCDKMTDGVLKYIEGERQAATQEIKDAVTANAEAKIKEFTDKLEAIKKLPGTGSFTKQLDEVIAMLRPSSPASSGASDASAANSGGAGSPSEAHASPSRAKEAGDILPTAPVRLMDVDPPDGAFGFDFGTPVQAAEQTCKAAGLDWLPTLRDHFRCSGLPKNPGLTGFAVVRACSGEVCAVAGDVLTAEAPMTKVREIEGLLRAKYGDASLPFDTAGCEDNQTIHDCLAKHPRGLGSSWLWASGSRIRLEAGTTGLGARVRVIYVGKKTPLREGL